MGWDGDPALLLDVWAGAPLAIVVDASSSGAEPGTITEIDASASSDGYGLRHSTHAMGVMEAVQLGKALGRMPYRLRIFGIEGADFGFGARLTREVAGAVGELVERIRDEMTNDR